MAFKPIKMSDCTAFVSTHDEAVDRDKLIEKYLESDTELAGNESLTPQQKRDAAWSLFGFEFATKVGGQPSKSLEILEFKEGETPCKFVIGAIPSEDLNRIYDETQETPRHRGAAHERAWRGFLHGLRNIEGWPGEVKKRTVGEIEYVDPQWLRTTFVRGLRQVGIQVGQVILAWNELTVGEVKN